MKLKTLLLTCILLFTAILVQAISLSNEGFDKLKYIYTTATKALNNVEKPDQLPNAMATLNSIQERYNNDADVKNVLSISDRSCPSEFKVKYGEILKYQADLKDVGKRLAMSGVLQAEADAIQFKTFFDTFFLSDSTSEEVMHTGAPVETKEERDARLKWWRDGKFGMFIHYGLYSGLGGEVLGTKYEGCVEWIQMQSELDNKTYAEQAIPKFKPKAGKATEWVKLAKESGCKYIVLTSRHHDGFNMFDTKYTDYNVKKVTGVDIIEEYAAACKTYDIKTGYYVSLLDWSHPDYDPTGSGISYPQGNYDDEKEGKRHFGNHEKYKEYLFNIFDELSSNYKMDLVWWDFSQPNFQGDEAWGATRLMKTLFDKNPNAIQNNRLYHSNNHLSEGGIKVTPTWKGDYSTAEHHVPATGIDGDWETCQTLNGTWGYSADNSKWKTSKNMIQELTDAVSRGGNFLLNIGPRADGSIPTETIRLFKEIGAWMDINGTAIYGTRANPFAEEFKWGRVTKKGDSNLYLFIYDKVEDGLIELPCTFDGMVAAAVLKGNKSVPVSKDIANNKTVIDISNIEMQNGATVIKLTGEYKNTSNVKTVN